MQDNMQTKEGSERPWRDADILRELYHGDRLSLRAIGDRLGCHNSTVYENMQRHGIETRDRRVAYANFSTDARGYERWEVWDVDQYRAVKVHQLLAIACGAQPEDVFGPGNATHHINGVPWDNRPDNVEAMSQSEHMRIHAQEA